MRKLCFSAILAAAAAAVAAPAGAVTFGMSADFDAASADSFLLQGAFTAEDDNGDGVISLGELDTFYAEVTSKSDETGGFVFGRGRLTDFSYAFDGLLGSELSGFSASGLFDEVATFSAGGLAGQSTVLLDFPMGLFQGSMGLFLDLDCAGVSGCGTLYASAVLNGFYGSSAFGRSLGPVIVTPWRGEGGNENGNGDAEGEALFSQQPQIVEVPAPGALGLLGLGLLGFAARRVRG